MYSSNELPTPTNRLKKLSSTNLCYASLILLLLNKKSAYVILISNLEDIFSVFYK
jgi:hypothetical protein